MGVERKEEAASYLMDNAVRFGKVNKWPGRGRWADEAGVDPG